MVEEEDYLYAVAEYILQNPVRARICADARDYPWAREPLGEHTFAS